DGLVTGVQTCALPIYLRAPSWVNARFNWPPASGSKFKPRSGLTASVPTGYIQSSLGHVFANLKQAFLPAVRLASCRVVARAGWQIGRASCSERAYLG